MDTPVKPKPVPVVNPWAKPFWDAAREEKLVIQHCQDCGGEYFLSADCLSALFFG